MPHIRCAYCGVVQPIEPDNILPTAKSLREYRAELNRQQEDTEDEDTED